MTRRLEGFCTVRMVFGGLDDCEARDRIQDLHSPVSSPQAIQVISSYRIAIPTSILWSHFGLPFTSAAHDPEMANVQVLRSRLSRHAFDVDSAQRG